MKSALQGVIVILAFSGLLAAQPSAAESSPPNVPLSKISDPLVRVLAGKGLFTTDELVELTSSGTVVGERATLAQLLRKKGLLTDAELQDVLGPAGARPAVAEKPAALAVVSPMPAPAAQAPAQAAAPAPPKPPAVVAAYAPLRVLPVDPPKREGLIPDIRISNGARLKPYGFIKASAIYDSSSPSATDMPLPYLNGDTGPNVDPEFHVRARNMRMGTLFEWLDSPKTVITGRFEADFEGDFTRPLNRNISSIRSSEFSIRLAYGRIDHMVDANNTVFLLVGQDWTPFGSSTLPNIIETTGLGLGFGTLYERLPQVRTGVIHSFGGSRNFKILPEFAITLPAFGNTPANVADQLGYGERQGADSGRPEVQGRIVAQWQLDKAPGVAPAQFIVSGVQASRKALVTAAAVPAAFKSAFPGGAEVSSDRWGMTVELQLPTRAITWTGKYYHGTDLRFYFVGGLYSNFNDTFGLTSTTTVPSIDGASNVVFGLQNGVPTIAPERPVRTQGFSTDLGLPLSRWFHANPAGRSGGWTANLHYSLDTVPARDARRLGGGGRAKNDMAVFTLFWKLNSLVTFAAEESMYRTRAANDTANSVGGLFTLRGVPAREWHDIRTEIGPIFTF
ncbi:MAG: hypothetical protein LAP87_11845 [Acidobacteriia bacterium]|nr:hypothetical protein [Terriglobia bacterium]